MKKQIITFILCISLCFLFIDCTPCHSKIICFQEKYIKPVLILNEYHLLTSVGYHQSYEQLYLDRAKLSEEELMNHYAYTREQIKILKEYDGSPLEENPQLALASATLSARMYTGGCSQTELNIMVEWSWSNPPLLSGPGITDRVCIRWQGTNLSGVPIDLVDNGSTNAIILYYKNGAYVTTNIVKKELNSDDIPIKMQIKNGIAMRGTLSTTLSHHYLHDIQEASVEFVYGHTQMNLKPLMLGNIQIPIISLDHSKDTIKLIKRVTNTAKILD